MKKNNIPAIKNAAPANAEITNKKLVRRQRRLRHLAKLGFSEDEILEIFKDESVRMVMCLYYTSFTMEGTRTKKIYHRDEKHHVTNVTEEEVKVTLTGRQAAEKFLKENNIEAVTLGPTYCYIKTDVDHVDGILETLKPLGRTSVTKPEPMTKEKLEKDKEKQRKLEHKENKKPTNNTAEVKVAAKAKRKELNKQKAAMRPYYAALRKGGVSARIKKYNKTLAEKIEKWLKDFRKAEAEKAENSKEYRAKHHQLTSTEMKSNKRARKVAKHLAAIERLQKRQAEAAVNNAKAKAERAQKAQKPVQTELKMAA